MCTPRTGTAGNPGTVGAVRSDRDDDERRGIPDGLPPRLRVIDVAGRGGTAVVWRARDRRAGRDVAVKVIPLRGSDDGASVDAETLRSRFDHEVRALARMAGHPHVLDILAAGSDDRHAWVVTPLAEGSLADVVTADGPLDAVATSSLAVALASALTHAHSFEVLHGDVTPANVLFVDGRAVLSDFGLATVQALRLTDGEPSPVLGATPGWAAPERIDGGPATAASDVYGLGATMWSAATARRPPTHRPPDPAAVARGLDVIIAECCDPDPARRPTASAVLRVAESERRRRDRYCPAP